jgi:hypothetical protein
MSTTFPFLSLPGEIRNLVYYHTLVDDTPIVLGYKCPREKALSLFRVGKLVSQQSLSVFQNRAFLFTLLPLASFSHSHFLARHPRQTSLPIHHLPRPRLTSTTLLIPLRFFPDTSLFLPRPRISHKVWPTFLENSTSPPSAPGIPTSLTRYQSYPCYNLISAQHVDSAFLSRSPR